jgi:hypothetical protein
MVSLSLPLVEVAGLAATRELAGHRHAGSRGNVTATVSVDVDAVRAQRTHDLAQEGQGTTQGQCDATSETKLES